MSRSVLAFHADVGFDMFAQLMSESIAGAVLCSSDVGAAAVRHDHPL